MNRNKAISCTMVLTLLASCAPHKANRRSMQQNLIHQFTVSWEPHPTDFVILSQGSIGDEQKRKLAYSADSFTARLLFLKFDYTLSTLSPTFEAKEAYAIQGDDLKAFVAKATSDSEKIKSAFSGSNYRTFSEQSSASDMLSAFKNGNIQEILRKDAHLSILVINDSNSETIDGIAEGLKNTLDKLKGKDQWSMSYIGWLKDPDHSDQCWKAPPDKKSESIERTTSESSGQEILNFVHTSGGVADSLCNESFSSFFEQWPLQSSGNAAFKEAIPKDLDDKRISIKANGAEVKGWSYEAKSGILMLPGHLAKGVSINVFLLPPLEPEINVAKADTGKTKKSDDKKVTDTSADESMALSIVRNNCSGCHSAGSGVVDLSSDPKVFEKDAAVKVEALRRIQLPQGDPDVMPPGGGMSAQQIAALKQYLESL